MVDTADPWGTLTRCEVYDCLPIGTLPAGLRTWMQLRPAIRRLSAELQAHVLEVAAAKEKDRKERRRQSFVKAQAKRCQVQQKRREDQQRAAKAGPEADFRMAQCTGEFLSLPTEEQNRERIAAFIDRTGNEALARGVCIVCAREMMYGEGE